MTSSTTSTPSKFIRAIRGVAAVALLITLTSGDIGTASAASKTATTKATPAAPAAKLGAPCATLGATATVASKSLTCSKALSGKLVWSASTGATPSIGGAGGAGGRDGGPGGGFGDGPQRDPAFTAAMAKYTACLKAQGVTLPAFGGRRGFGGPDDNNGQAQASPAPRPTLSAKQQAAMTKCASLRPAFGRGRFGGPNGGNAGNGNGFGGFGGVANTPANVAAYIACLNTNGVNISTLADLQGLDRQSPKVSAALMACRSKRVAQGPNN